MTTNYFKQTGMCKPPKTKYNRCTVAAGYFKCPSCEKKTMFIDATFGVCQECIDELDREDTPTW